MSNNLWGQGVIDTIIRANDVGRTHTHDLVLREVVDARVEPIYPDAIEDISTIQPKMCATCSTEEDIDLYAVENVERGYTQVKTFCTDCWVITHGEGRYL